MLIYIIGLIFLIIYLLFQFDVIRIVEKFGCGCRYCGLCTGNPSTCPLRREIQYLNENFDQTLDPLKNVSKISCPLCEKRRNGYGLNRFMTWRLGLGKWAGDIDELESSDSMRFYRGDPSKCPLRN